MLFKTNVNLYNYEWYAGVILILFTIFFSSFHFLAKANLLFVISVVVHQGVSLATALPNVDQVVLYTYKTSIFSAETAELKDLVCYKNYRILSLILLIMTAILAGFFL